MTGNICKVQKHEIRIRRDSIYMMRTGVFPSYEIGIPKGVPISEVYHQLLIKQME